VICGIELDAMIHGVELDAADHGVEAGLKAHGRLPDRYGCTYLPSPRETSRVCGRSTERCWALDMRVRYPPSVMTWVEEGIYVLGSKERTPVFRP
jgi:hypothetical protein